MANTYITEPPPTASVAIHTTAGPITISLFAQQTPLTCRNFLQHCLDGYYDNTIFHRISSGFVIQTGDPTGTGEGGTSIYEDSREFETYDAEWAKVCGKEMGEKIRFGDELHSRLRFGRRGLVGMAKDSSGGYGSQWFVTLGDVRSELDGKMTMFGRVEGNGIYNVVKIAEGEVVEGSERPVYPEKVLRVEVLEWPKGEAWAGMRRRERTAVRTVEEPRKKEKVKKKPGKALLSFGGGDEEDDSESMAVRPKKAKFNTALIDSPSMTQKTVSNGTTAKRKPSPPPQPSPTIPSKRKASSPPPSPQHHRRPSHSSPQAQLPIRNEETPSNSPSTPSSPIPSSHLKTANDYESQISALKASMRRDTAATASTTSNKPKSALEALIPATSTRGRKRPRPGDSLQDKAGDAAALKMLSAFRRRLEMAEERELESRVNGVRVDEDGEDEMDGQQHGEEAGDGTNGERNNAEGGTIDEEAQLCDLHFIANCQSCSRWDESERNEEGRDDDNDREFMSHRLAFGKDLLGKDLDWRKKDRNRDEDDGGLVVIDPRAKEKDIKMTEKERRGKRRRERLG